MINIVGWVSRTRALFAERPFLWDVSNEPRLGQARRRSGAPAEIALDPVRHEIVRGTRRDGGWTVGLTAEDLVGAQCRAVVGLGRAKDETWRSGQHMVGVWYSTPEDASAHQAAMECVPDGRFAALAVAPLASGRLDPPDIALFYATPGAMIYFINGLQWAGYKRFDWSVVGESACADSWGRALKTREPSLSIPCFAERRYGGVLDDEMLMALPPDYLGKAIAGMEALSKNGLRYPFPQYGIQQDARAGLAVSYPGRAG
jgi:uncharacterized protein (DUF169 family)